MTISVELLLNVVLKGAFAFLIIALIWEWKSNKSYASQIARIFSYVLFESIYIGLLTVKLLNSESYGFYLFMSYLWLFDLALYASSLNKK